MKIIALKSLSYRTRHMQAGETNKNRIQVGEEFEAKPKVAKVLIATGRARDSQERAPVRVPPPPVALADKVAPPEPEPEPEHEEPALVAHEDPDAEEVEDDLQPEVQDEPEHQKVSLRHEAEALGISVDGRWGIDRLREEIESARGKFGRAG